MRKKVIRIGDKVKITGNGSNCSTIKFMAKRMKAVKYIDGHGWEDDTDFSGKEGIIKCCLDDFYLIDIGDCEIIMHGTYEIKKLGKGNINSGIIIK